MKEGTIIGVISIKGGVGKTSCTVNLGTALSTHFSQKVLMVDANFSAPNLSIHVGIVESPWYVHDVINNKTTFDEAIQNHKLGFDILPACLLYKKLNYKKFKEKIRSLKKDYDIILIDSSPNLKDEMIATITTADKILVVTNPDYPTLSTTMMAVKLTKRKNTQIAGLIINRVRHKKYELSIDDIEDATGIPVLGYLPENHKIGVAIAESTPIVTYYPQSNVSIEFNKIAASLIGESYNDPRLFHRLKSYFKKDMTKEEKNRALYKNEY